MVVAAVVTAVLAVTLGGLRGFGGTASYHAPLSDAAGLSVGALVSVHGVEVGKVTELSLHDGHAMVHFEIDDDVVVRDGALAAVRARSLLGEKYLALQLGDGEALPEGTELPPIGEQYEVDELVAVLTPLLAAIDPAALEQASRALARAIDEDPELVARMLVDLQTTLGAVAEASEHLDPLLDEAGATLGEARGTLAVASARGREAQSLIARADRVLAQLEQASEPLPETVDEARATLADARQLLDELQGATEGLSEVVDNLEDFDREAVRELLREDGVRVRLFGSGK
jgi:phospholipid/cholesterol/gamma-HCH transport system substrate-binding protein